MVKGIKRGSLQRKPILNANLKKCVNGYFLDRYDEPPDALRPVGDKNPGGSVNTMIEFITR
ncbi:hypothetical protein GCM10028773_36930 [Spirosoma koreense]